MPCTVFRFSFLFDKTIAQFQDPDAVLPHPASQVLSNVQGGLQTHRQLCFELLSKDSPKGSCWSTLLSIWLVSRPSEIDGNDIWIREFYLLEPKGSGPQDHRDHASRRCSSQRRVRRLARRILCCFTNGARRSKMSPNRKCRSLSPPWSIRFKAGALTCRSTFRRAFSCRTCTVFPVSPPLARESPSVP
jgi:hypothetical protein